MKKVKRFLAVILCLVLIQAPLQMISAPVTVQAAGRDGLTCSKTSGRYYYYENGKKVREKWRKINGYTYYFGKSGAAYAAEKIDGVKYNIAVKKINGIYYGFDKYGHRVGGLNVTMSGTIFYFSPKTGVYAPKTTEKYRKAAKQGVYATNICKLLGKPVKTKKLTDLCMNWGNTGKSYLYKKYELQTVYDKKAKKERVIGLWVL